MDGVTAAPYQENLEEHLQDLVRRLETPCYRAKVVRRCSIPKDNGQDRPLGIPALEDTLVQLAGAKVLHAIYAQDVVECSSGYRPNRRAKETVADLTCNVPYGGYGSSVEADIKSFFDTIDHDRLLEMLAQRIDDNAFLTVIRTGRKAGILDTDGTILEPETGTPQGGVISPILANGYVHYTLDLWFEHVGKKPVRGEAMMCRYAEDCVVACRFQDDAERFSRVLPKRLGTFGLEVAPEKTQVLRLSRFHPGMKRRFPFLGFELYWLPDRQGAMRVKHRTSRKKLQGACRRIKAWIKANRHLRGRQCIQALNRRLQGHDHYDGLQGNSASLSRFSTWAKQWAFTWLNRRGGKRKSFPWQAFERA